MTATTNPVVTASQGTRAVLMAAATLTIMAPAVIAPGLPAMRQAFGADRTLVQLVLTVTSLAIAVTAPVSGVLADRIGRKGLLVGSLGLYAMAGTAGFFVPDIPSLMVTRVLLGLAVGGIMTSVGTLISDLFEGPRRARFLGLQAAFASAGGAVFLPLAGVLVGVEWRAPFWIYAVAAAVLPFAVASIPDRRPAPEPEEADRGVAETTAARPGSVMVGIYALALAATLVFYMAPTQLPFLMRDLAAPSWMTGIVVAGSTATSFVGALYYGRLRARLSFAAITGISVLLLGAGWLVVGVAPSVPLVLLGVLVGGVGVGFFVPNTNFWLSRLARPHRRARVLAGAVSAIFFGQFLSPLLLGPLIGVIGIGAAFLIVGTATLAAAVALLAAARRGRTRPVREAQAPQNSPAAADTTTGVTRPVPTGKVKPMIYHHNRFVFKATVADEQREEALTSLRGQGESIDSVVRYVVGKDVGGEFEYGAVFVIDDLDGYWEYLTAPSHAHTDRIGLPLLETFVSYDTTDSDDPDIAEKIEELHARRYAGDPELTKLVADLPSYTGSGAPASTGADQA